MTGSAHRTVLEPTVAAKGWGDVGRTVPKQHGAWAGLLVCFALGTVAGGAWTAGSGLLLAAGVAAIFARQSAAVWLAAEGPARARPRAWTFAYAALGGGAGLLLLAATRNLWLAGIGAAAFGLMGITLERERRRRGFSFVSEAAGMLGVSLMAPAAECAAAGAATARTAGLGILCAAWFAGGLVRVRHLVRCRSAAADRFADRLRAGFPVLALHGGALALAAALAAWTPLLPPVAAAALAPAAFRAAGIVARRRAGPVAIRQVGRIELIHSLVFAALAALAWRT